jgi:glycine hydroxymethyltransferase
MQGLIFDLIAEERRRQASTINLIASENYVGPEELAAVGSVLTNKYAEGFSGRRFYGGCEVVDKVEFYAMDMGKKLFECEHINVQPHSGSSANMAAYFSVLQPGDTVLGMAFSAGGHLTHGHKVNFSGKLFNFVSYGVSPENELIDYDEVEILADQHSPKMIVVGASAYSRTIDYRKFYDIAKRHKSILLVDMAHIAGLIAAKQHPSPIPFADVVTSTTHKTLRGPRGGFICCKGDYSAAIDKAVMPGCQGGPLMHVIAAKGITFEKALCPEFCEYQKQVIKNAKVMAKAFIDLGYRVVSGGTDTHLFLIDVSSNNCLTGQEMTGRVVEEALAKCNIVLNRNVIPFEERSPIEASGVRIGTPAVTTRGFKEKEVIQVAHWIDEVIKRRTEEDFVIGVKKEVEKMCKRFPISN